jgi:nucleotide-binding universal stress UspA family protein
MDELITVGYNGTPASREALEWAAGEAEARGAQLRIVSCYEIPYAGEPFGFVTSDLIGALLDSAQAMGESARDAVLAGHPRLVMTVEPSPGPASLVLAKGAEPTDLVVVGASHRHGVEAFWLGSPPRYLTRHSGCPVVVVHGAASRGRPDRIVVGVDGSPAADAAVDWAAAEAELHDVPLVVVCAWSFSSVVTGAAPTRARDTVRGRAAATLQAAVARAERRGIAVAGALCEGDAVSAIVDSLRDGDLLVIGQHGSGAVLGVLGSTVNALVEACAVPVVVVGATRVDTSTDPSRGEPEALADDGVGNVGARPAQLTVAGIGG